MASRCGERVEIQPIGGDGRWLCGRLCTYGDDPGRHYVQLDPKFGGSRLDEQAIAAIRPLSQTAALGGQPPPVVGSFWGGLAKLANPFSSPLSPIAQARKVVSAFRGGGGRAPAPPSYAPPPYDPSQQFAPPYDPSQQFAPSPPYDPSQQYAPPSYASPMYAPPPMYTAPPMYGAAPGPDWSQYTTPGAGWDAAFGGPTYY